MPKFLNPTCAGGFTCTDDVFLFLYGLRTGADMAFAFALISDLVLCRGGDGGFRTRLTVLRGLFLRMGEEEEEQPFKSSSIVLL